MELQARVKKALEQNRNYPLGEIFFVINRLYCTCDQDFIAKLRKDQLKHSFESVSRAVRKVREDYPELRDVSYHSRQEKAENYHDKLVRESKMLKEKQDPKTLQAGLLL